MFGFRLPRPELTEYVVGDIGDVNDGPVRQHLLRQAAGHAPALRGASGIALKCVAADTGELLIVSHEVDRGDLSVEISREKARDLRAELLDTLLALYAKAEVGLSGTEPRLDLLLSKILDVINAAAPMRKRRTPNQSM